MSKYKVGDAFVIKVGHGTVDPLYGARYFIKGFNTLVFDDGGLDRLERYDADAKANADYNAGYEDGLKDAWECARKAAMYDVNIYEVFGTTILKRVWDMNPSEAVAKLKEYEAKQSEIKVGDEVTGAEGGKGIITHIREDKMYILWEDGSAGEFIDAEKWFKKTGRHYDIDSIFEQLKGTDDGEMA